MIEIRVRLEGAFRLMYVAKFAEGREAVMHLNVEVEREEDGRWIAEVPDLLGVLAYGESRDQAIARAEASALRVLADRLEHEEAGPDLVSVTFRAA